MLPISSTGTRRGGIWSCSICRPSGVVAGAEEWDNPSLIGDVTRGALASSDAPDVPNIVRPTSPQTFATALKVLYGIAIAP